jgi:HEAT repeat protein
MAWKALSGRAHNAAFVPVLLDDLKNHPDEYVRSSAATALSNYIDLPEVQAAFEEARNDPSMEVRRVVERDSP